MAEGFRKMKAALLVEKIDAEVRLIWIDDREAAIREKFLGSPSFRVNGQDLWHENCSVYDLSCRIYSTEQGLRGYPTVEMLREKIRQFQKGT
ncbi:MAG: hypothetical protein WHV66_12900 [Anaerolineales bacterium]|jgi:hypothetical protein